MIQLSPLSHAHLPHFFPWVNDQEAIEHGIFAFHNMSSIAQITRWFEETLQDPACLNLAIIDQQTKQCLGYAGLSDIDHSYKTAEYFIFIGNKEFWHKGIGTEVTRQVVEIGFKELKLKTIMLTVSADHPAGLTVYERAGFTVDGRHRKSGARAERSQDVVVMSIENTGSADG